MSLGKFTSVTLTFTPVCYKLVGAKVWERRMELDRHFVGCLSNNHLPKVGQQICEGAVLTFLQTCSKSAHTLETNPWPRGGRRWITYLETLPQDLNTWESRINGGRQSFGHEMVSAELTFALLCISERFIDKQIKWYFKSRNHGLTVFTKVEVSGADDGPGPGSPGTGSKLGLICSGSFTGSGWMKNTQV